MKIAIIGSGISGMVPAYLLHDDHEIEVFEANDYIGGHTHMIDVRRDNINYAIDTGFIVLFAFGRPEKNQNFQELREA